MDGLLDNNFALGFLLAKDRPREEALLAGVQASQFRRDSVIGLVLLKKHVQQVEELSQNLESAQAETTQLRATIKELEDRVDQRTIGRVIEEIFQAYDIGRELGVDGDQLVNIRASLDKNLKTPLIQRLALETLQPTQPRQMLIRSS